MRFTIRKKLMFSYLLLIFLFVASNFIVNSNLIAITNDSNQEIIESVRSSIDDFTYITIILGLTIALVTSYLIKKSINEFSIAIHAMADGDFSGDDIKIRRKDEFGELTESVNYMKKNLKNLISQVNETAKQVSTMSIQLYEGAEQTSVATKDIVTSIQTVTVNTEDQSSSVEETVKIVGDLVVQGQQINTNLKNATVAVNNASFISMEGNKAIQETIIQMNSIHSTVEHSALTIHELGELARHIGTIVQVITDIAAQTNLLALNAAIEAARAGEHGRGFSVVADEVRKLAEESASSGKQIAEYIQSIQQKIGSVVSSMEQGTKEVAIGIEVVHNAGQSFEKIQTSVQEVSGQIQEVVASVQQMTAGTDQMFRAVDVILNATERTVADTQSISASTEEQLAYVDEVTASSNQLSKTSIRLQELVSQFKV
ncbi:methyl-accepting chemotaxis protein [Schinkia azotoformans]|uniref:methyl-accepting chemotaxis protein n=1 Tax=Schinkia azotoformans TaxID=1454 RepID=UPI002DBB9CC3|nr:HAMP domain-containing methyl-accepting chemotaxis protein [Schinkia azotoformans]MEC1716085.1 HAMP domain-containing methyl-accepting chemotaxis protein [Schinkia azotoformans]MEC1756124.1 HAMP domain-containing methyl-accepting chemotaxis protein [Schinkia azotoformans]